MQEKQLQTRWLALLGITLICLYLCWSMVEPFLNVLIWSVVLVLIFYPVHVRIEKRTGKPSLSALISVFLVLIVVVVPLIAISTAVANEIANMAANFPRMLEELRNDPVKAEQLNRLRELAKKYIDVDRIFSVEALRENFGRAGQLVVSGTLNVLGGALGFIVNLFFTLFTMYYLFRDGHSIVEKIPSIIPLEHAQASALITRTGEVISASVFGVLVIALVQGILGGLMFWILGVPSSLVWGVVMTVLSTIPMAGAFIVWVPAAIVLGVTGHWVKALILTIWGTLVIGMADNFLRPRLVGQKTRLHELFIFFSVLGGLKVFGVLGILLGPVVVAITLALLDVFRASNEVVPALPVAVVADTSAETPESVP